MKRFLLIMIVGSRICLAQNSFPANGITTLNSGGDQNLILKDGRAGTNWNYIEWQFNDGTRDWVLGRHVTTGNFTLFRNGINDVLSVDNSGKVGIGTSNPLSRLTVQNTVPSASITYPLSVASLSPDAVSGSGVGISFFNGVNNAESQRGEQARITVKQTGFGVRPSFTISTTDYNSPYTQFIDRFIIDPQGNVGIGTTSPGAKLHINGNGGGNIDLLVNGRITTGDASNSGGVWLNSAQTIFVGQTGTGVGIYNGGSWRMIVDNTGNVGIGTLSPDAKLAVSGQVHAQEVKVSIAVPGPDYVFNKDYKLTSLEEIKNYIDQNKHLPEVPSAKEMEKNGVQLGEMNMLLLKKIEELTLHLIDQNKRLANLEAENKDLKDLIKK